jgi:hypothetical protein
VRSDLEAGDADAHRPDARCAPQDAVEERGLVGAGQVGGLVDEDERFILEEDVEAT